LTQDERHSTLVHSIVLEVWSAVLEDVGEDSDTNEMETWHMAVRMIFIIVVLLVLMNVMQTLLTDMYTIQKANAQIEWAKTQVDLIFLLSRPQSSRLRALVGLNTTMARAVSVFKRPIQRKLELMEMQTSTEVSGSMLLETPNGGGSGSDLLLYAERLLDYSCEFDEYEKVVLSHRLIPELSFFLCNDASVLEQTKKGMVNLFDVMERCGRTSGDATTFAGLYDWGCRHAGFSDAPSLQAVLTALAIMNLGKCTSFSSSVLSSHPHRNSDPNLHLRVLDGLLRNIGAGSDEGAGDGVASTEMVRFLPSFVRLTKKHQLVIREGLRCHFTLGQFLQLETPACNLLGLARLATSTLPVSQGDIADGDETCENEIDG
jgi:hypothetical protein